MTLKAAECANAICYQIIRSKNELQKITFGVATATLMSTYSRYTISLVVSSITAEEKIIKKSKNSDNSKHLCDELNVM